MSFQDDEGGVAVMVADVSGQKTMRVPRLPRDSSVGELLGEVIPQMRLPAKDGQGRLISYRARLDRTGQFLHNSEITGEVLEAQDKLTIQPSIEAGGNPG